LGLLVNLLDTQAEADAEIIRIREGGVAHVFAVPLVPAWSGRPTVAHSSADSARAEVMHFDGPACPNQRFTSIWQSPMGPMRKPTRG